MSSKIFDTIIVGAGVSGISCAIELKIQNIEKIDFEEGKYIQEAKESINFLLKERVENNE